jgi:FMN phosphatase YigB (HAD superfamily)
MRDLFGRLYGTDLINTFKEGPAYYERAFADAGEAPGEALVVNASPAAVAWTRQAGARAPSWWARQAAARQTGRSSAAWRSCRR